MQLRSIKSGAKLLNFWLRGDERPLAKHGPGALHVQPRPNWNTAECQEATGNHYGDLPANEILSNL